MTSPILRSLAVALALTVAVGAAPADPSVERMFANAGAKEQAVRTALGDAKASTVVLKAVRTVVADYEAVVRRFPSSAYCDDALWKAAQLSLLAYEKFGEGPDKTAAIRLLRTLMSQYPSSRFARQAPEVIKSAEARPVATAATSGPGDAGRPTRVVTIKDIRRVVLPDTVRIIIELDGEVRSFHDERLESPLRVFVDLAGTRAAPQLIDRTIRFESDADAVRQVRLGRHPNETTRVVLDAAGISSYSVYPLYSPYRLVIDCLRETTGNVAAAAAVRTPPAIALPARPLPALLPPVIPLPAAGPITGPIVPAVAPPAAPVPVEAAASAASAPPARNLAGGFSMARQLGLGVSRIVIDPGHGGQDPGAVGKGVTEAALVLDIALRLEKLLAKVPDIEVILTRRSDEYIPLQERTLLANREGADLFLSIHANASNNTRASGVETYFLNFATNASAAAIAARENAASGHQMGALPDIVKAIALNNKLDESRDFATMIQRAMVERLRPANKTLKDLGVKQAPFVVLIGAAMPSVLAEISFLTNAQEVRLLRQNSYRQRIAEALFNAIRKYQAALKTSSKVAAQE
jgi:N-acetylmuramoyl-L-alanine amidase